MKDEKEKADEIVKKRRLAANGLKVRGDGKPVDPMEDYGEADVDPVIAESEEEKQERIARRGTAIAGLRR